MYFRLFFSSIALLTIYTVSEYVFTPMHLYFEIKWLDKPVHFLGGASVALFTIAMLNLWHKQVHMSNVLAGTVFIAILWELYEFTHDVLVLRPWNGWFDSSTDVLFGILGGALTYFLYKKKYL